MQYIGKLNREIYKCVSSDIVTDDVIITAERIDHIKKRHPNDYELYCAYIGEIISEPDYIIEDDRPATAMVLKEIAAPDTSEHFRLALRLVTPSDQNDYKNSVITFMKIRKKEYNRIIRNKTILYKRD